MKVDVGTKKIPTVVGLFIIAIGIFGTSYLAQNFGSFLTGATTSEAPAQVKITNVTNNSFTVSWVTESENSGSVSFWKEKNQEATALDGRDKPENIGRYKTHHVVVNDLTPQMKYFFKIQSGKDSFDDNGSPYSISTGPKLEQILSSQAGDIEGSVINEDGSAGNDVLIYVNIPGAYQLSTQTAPNGKWKLPLAFTTSDLKDWFKVLPDQKLDIVVTNGQKSSKIETTIENAIAPITLGQNYSFLTMKSEEASKSSTSSSQKKSSFEISPTPQVVNIPKLNNPKEGENFTDAQPRFSGSAPKGTTIKITIESEPITTTIKADSSGNWSFRPSAPLSPGEHTITISAPDSSGVMRAITRKFQVFAEGSQVNESATPSATPTLKLSPTPVATLTPIPIKTTVAPTISVAPTNIPVPTKAPQPPPVTGVIDENLPLFIFGAFGVMAFLAGLALLF